MNEHVTVIEDREVTSADIPRAAGHSVKRGHRKVRMNVWGNLVGSIRGARVEEFAHEIDAAVWLNAAKLTPTPVAPAGADPGECGACGGPLVELGALGALRYFRCRDCGLDQRHREDGTLDGDGRVRRYYGADQKPCAVVQNAPAAEVLACRACRAPLSLNRRQQYAARTSVTCGRCGSVIRLTRSYYDIGHAPAKDRANYLTDRGLSGAERRDCTVRALATAGGLSYADAHAALALVGRQVGRGFWPHRLLDHPQHLRDLLGLQARRVFHTGSPRGAQLGTLLSGLLSEPGRYYVLIRAHAFGLVVHPDGRLESSDSVHRPTELVREVWELTSIA